MAIATISMKMKLGLSALKPIFMRSDSLPFMSSGQLKILPRKSVICSPSATMFRRSEDAYTHLTASEMEELKTKLPTSCKKPDRITQFHHYDRSVNYHEETES